MFEPYKAKYESTVELIRGIVKENVPSDWAVLCLLEHGHSGQIVVSVHLAID